MSKNKKYSKKGKIFYMSSEEATLIKMPKYNGYKVGHGMHGDKKYNRSKEKKKWKEEFDES